MTGLTPLENQKPTKDTDTQRNEERYRAFITRSSEGIFRVELRPPIPVSLPEDEQIDRIYREGCMAECNDAMARMYGFTKAEEMVERRIEEFIIRADPNNTEFLRAFIQGGYQLTDVESHERDCHGQSRWFLNSVVGTVEDGLLVRTWGVQRDITERKQVEEALRDSEERFRRLVEISPDGIFLNRHNRVAFANQAALKLLRAVDASQVVGKDALELIHPDYHAAVKDRMHHMLEDHRPVPVLEEKFVRVDGSLVDVEVVATPFVDREGPAIQVMARDITERKRAEEERRRLEAQMQQTQKLESLGVLAGGIAHDFNNLLTAILGYADLALLELPRGSTARSSIEQVIMGSRRAAELALQMLVYAGKGRSILQPSILSDLVRNLAELLKVSISKKAFLQCDFALDLPPIEADASQLRQVVMNLIINASDALGERDGAIAVRTATGAWERNGPPGCFRSRELPEGEYVILEVADTGCGMSPDVLSRIFDPFFTTKFTGRGLGLAAVLGIVQNHGGAIQVSSMPGKGTTFQVFFPIARQSVVTVPSQPTTGAWTGSGTVLVIDDEEAVCGLARRMLQSFGFKVLTARDGRKGVEAYRTHAQEISAVLLDLTMPGLDGVETLQELRRIQSDVRVILSSGYGEEGAMQRLGEQRPVAFVAKPYRLEALKKALRCALEGQR